MSKIGKKPILIPEKAEVTHDEKENTITVKGPLGELEVPVQDGIKVEIADGKVMFSAKDEKKQTQSNWGTARSLIQNAVIGTIEGFEKTLILEGVGFRIKKEGEALTLALGFSHPVKVDTPDKIEFEVEKNSILKIKGIDKELVGQTAAKIRALKKPEPYKGKGFRYEDEVIRRKAGKKAVTAAE